MSDHSCPVVQVNLEPHPNADTLSIVKIGGYQCVVKTDEWKNGQLAVYIPPDSIVPFEEPFKFLGEKHLRIKARKMRGIISFGLLIPAPAGAQIGDDLQDYFKIEHYEPEVKSSTGGENISAPPGFYPKYDVENFKSPKYRDIIHPGEEVIITEKIHGANARFVYVDEIFYAGSRNNWKKYSDNILWWKAVAQNSWIIEWCKNFPEKVLYGEVFGQVQDLKYGAGKNEIRFLAFDILDNGQWVDYDKRITMISYDHWVPELYRGPFDEQIALALADENSSIPGAKHHREGVVIRPVKERWDEKLGRVQLKIIGSRYLVKA